MRCASHYKRKISYRKTITNTHKAHTCDRRVESTHQNLSKLKHEFQSLLYPETPALFDSCAGAWLGLVIHPVLYG